VTHFAVDLGLDATRHSSLAFYQPKEAISLDLLDRAGNIVCRSATAERGRLTVDTSGLEEGRYLLRVARNRDAGVRNNPLDLKVAPPLLL
jgi:hypothetical protein